MHTAPWAYSKHAPGAVCIQIWVLEHISLTKFFQIINASGGRGQNLQKVVTGEDCDVYQRLGISDMLRGGRTRLPKFKFSAKFPIGLHVILQIQIKKFENDCYIMWKIILTENPLRFNVEPLLKQC